MKDRTKEVYMYMLGAVVFLCSPIITVLLIKNELPASNVNAIMLATGQLLTLSGMVVGYFFGSSKSSADKTEILSALGEDTKSKEDTKDKEVKL